MSIVQTSMNAHTSQPSRLLPWVLIVFGVIAGAVISAWYGFYLTAVVFPEPVFNLTRAVAGDQIARNLLGDFLTALFLANRTDAFVVLLIRLVALAGILGLLPTGAGVALLIRSWRKR